MFWSLGVGLSCSGTWVFRAVKLAEPSSMELKKLEIELYFSVPVEIMEIKKVIRAGRGRGARALVKKRFS